MVFNDIPKDLEWPDDYRYGLEIELENIVNRPPLERWIMHYDGSLRNNGLEYVLAGPKSGMELHEALQELQANLPDTAIANERCGLHVHLDVMNFDMERRERFFKTMLVFEKLLYKISGDRETNKNCVPTYYNANFLREIGAIATGNLQHIRLTPGKYAGLNFNSIITLGSLEVRMHEGTVDFERILRFVRILGYIRAASATLDVQREELLDDISRQGANTFLEEVFPEDILEFLGQFNTQRCLLFGIRQLQAGVYTYELDKNPLDDTIPDHLDDFPNIKQAVEEEKPARGRRVNVAPAPRARENGVQEGLWIPGPAELNFRDPRELIEMDLIRGDNPDVEAE